MIRQLLLSGLVVLVSLMMMPTNTVAATTTSIIGETTQGVVDQQQEQQKKKNGQHPSSSAGRLRNSSSNSNNILNIIATTTTTTNQGDEIENEDLFLDYFSNELTCQDDKAYRYENDPLKDCITWVSLRPNKRCSMNSGVVFIFDDNDDNDDSDCSIVGGSSDDSISDTATTSTRTTTSTTDGEGDAVADGDGEYFNKNKMEVTIKFFCPSVCNSKCLDFGDNENVDEDKDKDKDEDKDHTDYDNENESLFSKQEQQQQEQEKQLEREQQRDLRSWSWGSSSAGGGSSSSSSTNRVSNSNTGNSYLSKIFGNNNKAPPPQRRSPPRYTIVNNRGPRPRPRPVQQVYYVDKPRTSWTGMYQTAVYVPSNNRPATIITVIDETQQGSIVNSSLPPVGIPPTRRPTVSVAPVAPTTPRPSVSYKKINDCTKCIDYKFHSILFQTITRSNYHFSLHLHLLYCACTVIKLIILYYIKLLL